MALSNMRKEPQREIMETAIGVILVGGFLTGDYYFSLWTQQLAGGFSQYPWPVGMFFNGLGLVLGILLMPLFIHFIGEITCDALAEGLGIYLRPRDRGKRWSWSTVNR